MAYIMIKKHFMQQHALVSSSLWCDFQTSAKVATDELEHIA